MSDEDVDSVESQIAAEPDPDSSPYAPAALEIVEKGLDEETVECHG